MGNVVNLAEYRSRKQPLEQRVAALIQPPTKEEVARGVAARFKALLAPLGKPGMNTQMRLIGSMGARAIVKKVKESGHLVSPHGRFQFFGVKDGETYHLLGRVNFVCDPESLGHYSAMYLIDPGTTCAFPLSGTDNIPKNNTFTTLITLPMSDMYNL